MDWSRRAYYRRQKMLRNYTVWLGLLSFSVFLMPIVDSFKKNMNLPLYLVGALFWLTLISTIYMAVRINNSRRRNLAFNEKYGSLKKLALIHFFQNKKALIMDAVMFASIIAFVITRFLNGGLIIQFLFVSMFVFSFGMHCMLNGINYIYIKHKISVRRD